MSSSMALDNMVSKSQAVAVLGNDAVQKLTEMSEPLAETQSFTESNKTGPDTVPLASSPTHAAIVVPTASSSAGQHGLRSNQSLRSQSM